MLAQNYSPLDFLWQFMRLLPRGAVWRRAWGSAMAADILTLMPAWARLDTHANGVIAETFPCTTTAMLPEWEASLGLPDPCTGPLATLQQRTAAVCSKFSARGGASMEYFTHLAASLGFQIEIETFKPFMASQGRAGDPLYDESWAYTYRIIVESSDTVVYFRASASAAGEPLAEYQSTLLQCELERLTQAHITIIWGFRIDSSVWDDGNSIWDNGDSVWDEGQVTDGIPS